MSDEFARIARIAGLLGPREGAHGGEGVELGIGDDAAVLQALGRLVWTIDASVEGVHFRRAWLSFEDVGYRATVAAASDVLAMGARPLAALAAWTLPLGFAEADVDAIARGQRAAADALGATVIGGNLSDGPVVSITTTVVGTVDTVIRRSGARAGDLLVLAGAVGEAAVGLAALRAGLCPSSHGERAIDVWRRPPVLRSASAALALVAHAMIDVSDGLAQDAGHVALASGVRLVLELASLPRSPDVVALADRLGIAHETAMLAGGEDYALLAAVPADARIPSWVTIVGHVDEGEGVTVTRDGVVVSTPQGHRHGIAR